MSNFLPLITLIHFESIFTRKRQDLQKKGEQNEPTKLKANSMLIVLNIRRNYKILQTMYFMSMTDVQLFERNLKKIDRAVTLLEFLC